MLGHYKSYLKNKTMEEFNLIAQTEFNLSFDQLGINEQQWVIDEYKNVMYGE